MLQVTLGSLRTSSRRYVATVLAIVLGVGFVAATLVLSATLGASVRARIAGDVGRYAVVVTPTSDAPSQALAPAVVDAVAHTAGVASARGSARTFARISGAAQRDTSALTWPDAASGSPLRLTAGAGPRSEGDLVVSTSIATRAGLTVGSSVTLGDAQGRSHTLRVTGLVDTSASGPEAPDAPVYATAAAIARWSGSTGVDEIDVVGAPGVDDATLRDRVSATVAGLGTIATTALDGSTASAPVVRTGADQADAQVRQALKGTDTLTLFLLAFAVVALFVSALVIANTFAILVAQRLQQLALVRCVGATRRQVFGSVVTESVVVGLLGSVAGVGLGVAAAAVVSRVATRLHSPLPLQQLGISVIAIVVPVLAGTVVTVAAALFPAARATRVSPLAALRPDVPSPADSRAGVLRLVVAALLIAGGGAALVVGSREHLLVLAIPGGMVSFVGVLLAAVVVVPAAVRVVGLLPRALAGVPGDLAVENAVRNRSRAAATSSALLVGVTLITMTGVAAGSAEAAITDYLSARYPVDAQISARAGALTPAVVAAVGHTAGVVSTVTLPTGDAPIGRATGLQQVTGIPTDTIGTVLRSGARSSIARVHPGTIVVATYVAQGLGLVDGARTTLGTRPVTAVVMAEPFAAVMAADSDLAAAGVATRAGAVLLRLDDATDPSPVIDRLARTLAAVDDVVVDGAAPQRAEFARVVAAVLLVVTGLLAVAVLIALVGIGNTLALSVLERGRESALVRALGLTRGQLRASLALEAGLLSLVGALLGVALGIGYGYAGATALLGSTTPVPLVVPWARVLLVVAVALVAGVAAAWLPSRRAARIAPAAALALD